MRAAEPGTRRGKKIKIKKKRVAWREWTATVILVI